MESNRVASSDSSIGIDLQRIKNPELSIEELKCLLCSQIAWNPVSCPDCESLYCNKCHQEWIEKNTDTGTQCKEGCDSKITPVGKVISKFFSRLLVTCLNEEHGCSEIIPYNDLEQHEKVCPYQQSICPGCRKMILTAELTQHTEICGEIPMTCPTCEKVLTRDEFLKSHEKLDCVLYKMEKMEQKNKKEALFQTQIKNMGKIEERGMEENNNLFQIQYNIFKKNIDEKLKKMEDRHQEEINSLQNQIKAMEKDHTEKLKKTEERHQEEMNFFRNSYHEELKILEDNFAKKLEILVEKYDLRMKIDNEALINENLKEQNDIRALWCWDANRKSPKIELSENNTKAVKIGDEQSYSAVLGNKKFQSGQIYLWEISVSTQDISKSCQWIQIGIIEVSSEINLEIFPYKQAFGFTTAGFAQQINLTSYGNSLRNSAEKLDNKTYRLELNTKIGSFKVLHEGAEVCSASNSKFKESEFLAFVVLHQKNNTATLKIID